MIHTSTNDIKERLSLAYVTAIAGRIGCQVTETKIDRMGIDVTISAIKGTKAKIDVQLKATSSPIFVGSDLKFDLDIPTYDHLRSTQIGSGQILVVVALHSLDTRWLRTVHGGMSLRRNAYWVNLYGQPAATSTTTSRVSLPLANRFDEKSLKVLFDNAHARAMAGQTGL